MHEQKHVVTSGVHNPIFQELECLQDHLEDLMADCRDLVGNMTELESEVRSYWCFLVRMRWLREMDAVTL